MIQYETCIFTICFSIKKIELYYLFYHFLKNDNLKKTRNLICKDYGKVLIISVI